MDFRENRLLCLNFLGVGLFDTQKTPIWIRLGQEKKSIIFLTMVPMWQSFSDDLYKIARKGSTLPITNKLRLLAAALASGFSGNTEPGE